MELEYRAVPSDEELETIREVGQRLTTDPESVSVRIVKTEKNPVIVLGFVMKNQAQYNVVSEISDEVQRWLNEPYNDIAIRFHQPRKKARSR